MKFIEEMSVDKLRGGFYSPSLLVNECYSRLPALVGKSALNILEPSAGDGAFVRASPEAMNRFGLTKPRFTCVEIVPEEAEKCRSLLRSLRLSGNVITDSFFAWARENTFQFDAVIGNPPFVRYQFVSKSQRDDADHILASRGKEFHGVANLWIPFLLISVEQLREGGAFAFILPRELFSIKSASLVRSELVRNFEHLRVDLYERGHFPDILQDVIVLSGRKAKNPASSRRVKFVEHGKTEDRKWSHVITDSISSWTRYLLTEAELAAYECAKALPKVHSLGSVASIGASIVTGANEFFTVDDDTLAEYDLGAWAKPLLAKTSDCPGLVFGPADHSAARAKGKRVWILNFAEDLPDPMAYPGPRKYIGLGVQQRLPTRYKCRIRTPWYRVPDVRFDSLMLTKRAHQFHRLLLNKAKARSTDTIYRGRMRALYADWQDSLIATFHNSLTILSTEIEGRTYGGGVLELIPSEVGRLSVPLVEMGKHLGALDKVCRKAGGQLDADDVLIQATDKLLVKELPLLRDHMDALNSARLHLRQRRFLG